MSHVDKGERYDYLFKIIIIGDSNVGKTKLTSRFVDDKFVFEGTATIGVELMVKTVEIDGVIVKTQLWDTAGQDKYNSVTTNYYRGSHGVILVYDITSNASFLHLDQWFATARDKLNTDVPIMVIGNKSDLNFKREVTTEEAGAYCTGKGVSLLETSAYDGSNVIKAFAELIRAVYEKNKGNKALTSVGGEAKACLDGVKLEAVLDPPKQTSAGGGSKKTNDACSC